MTDDGSIMPRRPVTVVRAVTDFLLIGVGLVATMFTSMMLLGLLLAMAVGLMFECRPDESEPPWAEPPPIPSLAEWLQGGAMLGVVFGGVLASVWLLRFSMRRQAAQKNLR